MKGKIENRFHRQILASVHHQKSDHHCQFHHYMKLQNILVKNCRGNKSRKFPMMVSLLPTQRGIEPRSKCFKHYHTSGAHIIPLYHTSNLADSRMPPSEIYLPPPRLETCHPPRHKICKNYIRQAIQRYSYRARFILSTHEKPPFRDTYIQRLYESHVQYMH